MFEIQEHEPIVSSENANALASPAVLFLSLSLTVISPSDGAVYLPIYSSRIVFRRSKSCWALNGVCVSLSIKKTLVSKSFKPE